MKRIKEKDWTSLLQERLKDAQLPLKDNWAAETGLATESRTAGPWWPWALAGVAAAAVAAVLLLRPARQPEPDRLAQVPEIPAVVDAEPAEAAVLPPQVEQSRPTGEATSVRRPAVSGRPPVTQMPKDTIPVVLADTASVPSALPRDLLVEGGGENPEPAGEIIPEAAPLSELALADLSDLREEQNPSRRRAGRVSLRVQASAGGAVQSSTPTTVQVFQWVDNGYQKVYANDGKAFISDFATVGYSGNIVSGNTGPGDAVPGNADNWFLVKLPDTQEAVLVPVEEKAVFPLTVGVSAAIPLSRHWALTAGLDYAQRAGARVLGNAPQTLTLHYLGIPVDLHYYFNPESRFRFYLGAGAHAAKCIYATGGEPLADPVLFSGNLMAGADYRLAPGVRAYLAPAVSSYFNKSAYVAKWDDKLQFQLSVGLSFELK